MRGLARSVAAPDERAAAAGGGGAGKGTSGVASRQARRDILATTNVRLRGTLQAPPGIESQCGHAAVDLLLQDREPVYGGTAASASAVVMGLERGGDITLTDMDDPRILLAQHRHRKRQMSYALDAWTIALARSWGIDLDSTCARKTVSAPASPSLSPPSQSMRSASGADISFPRGSGVDVGGKDYEFEEQESEEGFPGGMPGGSVRNGVLLEVLGAWIDSAAAARAARRSLRRWKRLARFQSKISRAAWCFEIQAKFAALKRLLSRSEHKHRTAIALLYGHDAYVRRHRREAFRLWRKIARRRLMQLHALRNSSHRAVWLRKHRYLSRWKCATSLKSFCSVSLDMCRVDLWSLRSWRAHRHFGPLPQRVVALVHRRVLLDLLTERASEGALRDSMKQWRKYTQFRSRSYQFELRSYACFALTNVLRAFRLLRARSLRGAKAASAPSRYFISMHRSVSTSFRVLREFAVRSKRMASLNDVSAKFRRRRLLVAHIRSWRLVLALARRKILDVYPSQESSCDVKPPNASSLDTGLNVASALNVASPQGPEIGPADSRHQEICDEESYRDVVALHRQMRRLIFRWRAKLLHRHLMTVAASHHTKSSLRRGMLRLVDSWINAALQHAPSWTSGLEAADQVREKSSSDVFECELQLSDGSVASESPIFSSNISFEGFVATSSPDALADGDSEVESIDLHLSTASESQGDSLSSRTGNDSSSRGSPIPPPPAQSILGIRRLSLTAEEYLINEAVASSRATVENEWPGENPSGHLDEDLKAKPASTVGETPAAGDRRAPLPPPLLSSVRPLVSGTPEIGMAEELPADLDARAFVAAVRRRVAYV